MKKNIVFISLILLSAAGCGKKAQTTQTDERPVVRVQSVTSREVPQLVEFTATVEPKVQNNISANTPSRIKSIVAEVGDRVVRGQVLATMDDASFDQVKAQQADLEKNYNRLLELFQVGAIPQQQLDQTKAQLDVINASLRNIAENTTLVSPISGIVTARNFDAGDMASGAPILTVMQIQPVKVLINVSESFYSQIKQGMEVQVKVDVFGDEIFTGKVSLVYPTIDTATRTFPIEIEIPNGDSRIRPGMFARVTVNFGTQEHVVVPDLAVVKLQGTGDNFVYVLNADSTVSYNKVTLGQRLNTEFELLSGVENGAEVVVAGQSRLSNDAAVKVEK
ncbi:MAG: efflux RND transporter periplasmic adaptor subunit [Prevotellaceae bacterium]|jgi:RND family efflux transporter MFP subunit|nr:efflux RND transporter periplasmic adaptor subunit [Prevotellaceae bacterium]